MVMRAQYINLLCLLAIVLNHGKIFRIQFLRIIGVKKQVKENDFKYLVFTSITSFILIIAVLYFVVDPSVFFDHPWLIPITGILIVSVVCFAVAWITFRNYRVTGCAQVHHLGCGALNFRHWRRNRRLCQGASRWR